MGMKSGINSNGEKQIHGLLLKKVMNMGFVLAAQKLQCN